MLNILTILVVSRVVYTQASPLHASLTDGRIVGGRNTTIEEYPYQLSVEYNGEHNCGASLLTPRIALTAAHCTNGFPLNILRVRAGSTTRESGGEVVTIASICQHPLYSPVTIDYDVSVLVLSRSLTLRPSIQTISLQSVNVDVPVGTLGSVTGWGALKSDGPSPIILQVVEVPRVSDAVCGNTYDELTSRMICFGYDEGGKDSCQRDSGGPMVINGRQVGVVSYGNGCADPKTPGVYAKVFNADITSHINQCIANS